MESAEEILNLAEREFRVWLLSQLDKCDERFNATVSAVADSSKAQSEAIAAHAIASELRHKELLDRLSVALAISDGGKKGVGILGWISRQIAAFGEWLKKQIVGIGAAVFIYSWAIGKVKWSDIVAFFTR